MERTTRKKVFRWAATIGLIIGTICVAAFAFLYKLPTVYKYESDAINVKKEMPASLVKNSILSSEAPAPFLRTGMNNVFYSITDSGSAKYYRFDGKNFKEIKSSGSIDITLPLSEKKDSVRINLFKRGSKTEGYGVYSDKDSETYPYAFLRFEENNVTDTYNFIVFVDYTIKDFFNNNKTYETAYALNSETGDIEAIFPEKAVDGEIIIPVEFMASRNDGFYFFEKTEKDNGHPTYKLYKKNSVKGSESLICEDVEFPYVSEKDGSIYLFVNPSEDTADGFNLIKLGEEDSPIHKFSGTSEQYIIRDDCLLNKDTKLIYHVYKGELMKVRSSLIISNVQDFCVNNDGNKVIISGVFGGNKNKMMLYDFDYDTVKVYDGDVMFISENSNVTFLGDNAYFLAPAVTSSKVVNFVIPWENII